MSKLLKKKMAEEITSQLESVNSFILYDYNGLTAQDSHSLRSECFQKEIKAKALKNTMAAIAFKSKSLPEGLNSLLTGHTAMAFGGESIVSVAKLLVQFRQDHKKMVIKGGYIPGKVLSESDVEELSKMPSREELLSALAGAFQAPAQQIATILAGPPTNVSSVLSNLTSKMEESNIEKVGEAAVK